MQLLKVISSHVVQGIALIKIKSIKPIAPNDIFSSSPHNVLTGSVSGLNTMLNVVPLYPQINEPPYSFSYHAFMKSIMSAMDVIGTDVTCVWQSSVTLKNLFAGATNVVEPEYIMLQRYVKTAAPSRGDWCYSSSGSSRADQPCVDRSPCP